MKRFMLFIFLSISFFCQAQEGWIVDKNTGCKFYTTSNVEKRSFKWNGACIDSCISGNGKLEVFELDTLLYTYIGNVSNGKFSGQGTITWKDSSKYVGEWKDGKQSGQGTYTSLDGLKYVGEWKDDNLNGQGTIVYPNSNKYVGGWENGAYSGQGTYTSLDWGVYVGSWNVGKKDGKGTATFKDGKKYIGEWKEDSYNGQGTFIFQNDSKYIGQFKDGYFSGQGVLIFPNGEKYSGGWKDGTFDGYGKYTKGNGLVVYEGNFIKGSNLAFDKDLGKIYDKLNAFYQKTYSGINRYNNSSEGLSFDTISWINGKIEGLLSFPTRNVRYHIFNGILKVDSLDDVYFKHGILSNEIYKNEYDSLEYYKGKAFSGFKIFKNTNSIDTISYLKGKREGLVSFPMEKKRFFIINGKLHGNFKTRGLAFSFINHSIVADITGVASYGKVVSMNVLISPEKKEFIQVLENGDMKFEISKYDYYHDIETIAQNSSRIRAEYSRKAGDFMYEEEDIPIIKENYNIPARFSKVEGILKFVADGPGEVEPVSVYISSDCREISISFNRFFRSVEDGFNKGNLYYNFTSYYENGKIKDVNYGFNDTIFAKARYTENGIKTDSIKYLFPVGYDHNENDGINPYSYFEKYNIKGKLIVKGKKDIGESEMEIYYDNGNLKTRSFTIDSVRTIMTYYENGNLQSKATSIEKPNKTPEVFDRQLNLEIETFYANKILKSKALLIDDTPEFFDVYFENGKLLKRFYYSEKEESFIYEENFPDGFLKQQIKIENPSTVNKEGVYDLKALLSI